MRKMLMSASAANHLIEGGGGKDAKWEWQIRRKCLSASWQEEKQSGKEKVWATGERGEQRREKKMGRKKGMEGRQDASLSANGTRLH